MNWRKLIAGFERWKAGAERITLGTVVRTEGSTYSKAGSRILISESGEYQALLSGGCLEGDLAERATAVCRSGTAQIISYDLGGVDDELWGLGVGCDGTMEVLLQCLEPPNYAPFESLSHAIGSGADTCVVIALTDAQAGLRIGASAVRAGSATLYSDFDAELTERLFAQAARSACTGIIALETAAPDASFLADLIRPPPKILVLGAGLDAPPLVNLCADIGWRTTVADHRPAYFQQADFSAADATLCVPAEELHRHIGSDRFDAAVVMSHHLATDRMYLRWLADTDIAVIELLGPRLRRDALLDDIGAAAGSLAARVHGPAGIDIGAIDPVPIAVAIVAHLYERIGRR